MPTRIAVIEKNVPPPERGITSFGVPVNVAGTLRQLSKGDSFVIDDKKKRNSIFALTHRLGIKVRTTIEGEKLRVTRK